MPRVVLIGGSSVSSPGLAFALRDLENVDEEGKTTVIKQEIVGKQPILFRSTLGYSM